MTSYKAQQVQALAEQQAQTLRALDEQTRTAYLQQLSQEDPVMYDILLRNLAEVPK